MELAFKAGVWVPEADIHSAGFLVFHEAETPRGDVTFKSSQQVCGAAAPPELILQDTK